MVADGVDDLVTEVMWEDSWVVASGVIQRKTAALGYGILAWDSVGKNHPPGEYSGYT